MAKGFRLRFIQDDTVEQTEIIIRARKNDEEVERILGALGVDSKKALLCNTLSSGKMIDPNDIVIISKSGRYLSVKTTNGEYVLTDPLYKIEEELDPAWFMKISQSEIVNLRYVKGWSFTKSGIIIIELVNGIRSFTSRRYAKQIREVLRKGARAMGNRLVKRLLWGFVFGAVSGILISGFLNLLSGNGFSIVARELLLEKGKTAAVIMQVLFSGIYGAICIGGTIFYEIERMGLFFSTLSHFLCIMVSYSITALILRWAHLDFGLALLLIIIAGIFFVIWLVMGSVWRKNIREMNSELEKYKKENSK